MRLDGRWGRPTGRAKRRKRAASWLRRPASFSSASGGGAEHRVMANACADLRRQRGAARAGDGPIEGAEGPEAIGDLAQEECPGVGGETAAREVGDNGLASRGGAVEGLAVAVRQARALRLEGWGCVITRTLH